MQPDGYPVPADHIQVEDVVRRSRFITDLGRASTIDDARSFVETVRGRDPGATHHCWAYVVGPPGSTARVGFSDDGEPSGTAGQPMLTTLLHGGVGDVVAVCTRHYGGVKLGTGGLARAYGGGVKHALAEVHTVQRVLRIPAVISIDYADIEAVRRLLDRTQAVVSDESFGEDVRLECSIPAGDWTRFSDALGDATRGRAKLERTGDPRVE